MALAEDDLDLIKSWVEQTRIKWGVDGEYRGGLGLPAHNENTWQAGLSRMLLGYAMSPKQLFEGILPYGDPLPVYRACDLLLVPHALRFARVRMHLHRQRSTRREDLRENGGLLSGEVVGQIFGRASRLAFVNHRVYR